mgnify:CR=1 FL=1
MLGRDAHDNAQSHTAQRTVATCYSCFARHLIQPTLFIPAGAVPNARFLAKATGEGTVSRVLPPACCNSLCACLSAGLLHGVGWLLAPY